MADANQPDLSQLAENRSSEPLHVLAAAFVLQDLTAAFQIEQRFKHSR